MNWQGEPAANRRRLIIIIAVLAALAGLATACICWPDAPLE